MRSDAAVFTSDHGKQALPVDRLRCRNADRIEDRREKIHVADGRIHHPPTIRGRRRSNDQGNVHRRVVQEKSVG